MRKWVVEKRGEIVYFISFFLVIFLRPVEALPTPQISSLNPPSVGQGANAKNIAVYGTGFQCGVAVSFSDPSISTPNDATGNPFNNQCALGMIPSNVQYFSGSNIFFYVNIPLTTPAGPITFTLTNPDGTYVTGNLTINPAPAITPPVMSSVSPLTQGATTTVTLNGTGFQNGAVLTVPQAGIKINSLNINGAGTQASVDISVSPKASPSFIDLTLTNPDGGSVSLSSAILIQPAITDKTPALAVYEDGRLVNGIDVPFDTFWNGTWSQEGNILPSNSYYLPVVLTLKPHPFIYQQVMGHPVGSSLDFQILDHGAWGNQLLIGNFTYFPSFSKNFDMAYESQSGNGLVLYGTYSGISYRQIFQTQTACAPNPAPCWGPEKGLTSVINSNPNNLYWIKLVPNPDKTKNEILIAYEDSSGRLFVRSWNGNQFTAEIQISSSVRTDTIPFDISYTRTSNTGMVAWIERNNGTPRSCLWNGMACPLTASSPSQMGTMASSDLYTVQLSPDPSTDRMALGSLQNGGSVLKVQIWNGTNWPAASYPTDLNGVQLLSSQVYLDISSQGNFFNLIWKNNPRNVLFAVYTHADPNDGGGLNYQTWVAGTGWDGDKSVPGLPVQAAPPGLPFFESIIFDSDPRSGDLLGGMKDYYGKFFSIRWNESSLAWTDYTQISFARAKFPFGFSYFQNFPALDPATAQMTVMQGASVTLTIKGTLIQDGAVFSFPGFKGVSTTVTHQAGGVDLLSATGSVDPMALPGIYDFIITNPDRSRVTGKGLINISANPANPPAIFSVVPASRGQGAVNQALTLSGYNLPPSFSLSFTGNGTDITVTNQTTLSASQVSLQVSIAQNAVAGTRGIILKDLSTNQTFTFPNLFSVNFAPSILSVNPGSVYQGANQGISINGNDFQKGAVIVFQDGSSSLGWSASGGTSGTFYQNSMTGNLFHLSGPSSGVVLGQILINPTLVDPVRNNGQVAIYDNNGGVPGNLIVQSAVQALTTGLTGNFVFNLSPPVILSAPADYWILFNLDGAQTNISHDDQVTNCSMNGYTTPCMEVSKSQTFGSWPGNGGPPSSWSSVSGKRFSIQMVYAPIIAGSSKAGANTLGPNSYQNQMTGSQIMRLTANFTIIPYVYLYAASVDSINRSGSLAIYDSSGTGGTPGTLRASSLNNSLIQNNFNAFRMPKNFFLGPGTYWLVANMGGPGTTLTYDTIGVTESSVQTPQLFGTWPTPFPPVSSLPNTRYSIFSVGASGVLGNLAGTNGDGPDSNQITGSQFTSSMVSNISGISFYVNLLDPANQLGEAAIYDNDPVTNTPRNLIVSSSPQTLQPQSFNTLPVPVTRLPAGTYWIVANVNGAGTTLTYDNGTAVNGIKIPNPFGNPWPNPGGTGWTVYPGRRYAIYVNPDTSINSNVFSSNLINGTLSVNAGAVVGQRGVCVINPDGGQGCVTLDSNNQPFFQIVQQIATNSALTAYGTTLSTAPAYRKWKGYSPWGPEAAVAINAGGLPVWSVLRPYPHGSANDIRHDEKILGTVSTNAGSSILTFQVWNGSVWGFSFSQTVQPMFSRFFDAAYESGSGRGVVVYGDSTGPIPKFQVWDGAGWSLSQAVSQTASPGNSVLWVRLESNPRSNEMALLYLSGNINADNSVTNGIIHAMIWNGSVFGNEQTFPFPAAANLNLCGTCAPPLMTQPFDLAYEHSSGRALLAWGVPGNSTPQYIIWNGSQWNMQSVNTPFAANPAAGDSQTNLLFFRLTGDPNSNQIAMGTGTLNGEYDIQVWNGSNWGPPATRITSTPGPSFSLSGEWSATPPGLGPQWVSHLSGDNATFTFAGTEVNLIGQKNSNLGIANIYLDGQLKDRVDYYYPGLTNKTALFSLTNLSNTTHLLKIEPSGIRNQFSSLDGGSFVDSSVENQITGSMFTAKSDAVINGMSIFINTYDSGYSISDPCGTLFPSPTHPEYQIALYTDNGGRPDTLLAYTVQTCMGAPRSWYRSGFSPTRITGGSNYWILANVKGSQTTLTYSPGSSATKSVKMSFAYGSWPASFASTAAWSATPGIYYSFYASVVADQSVLGLAPPVTADSIDVKNGLISPSVVSTNLLYYSSPPSPANTDPNSLGRNFDLAWEKNSGNLLTVFGSPNSINTCGSSGQNGFPYATRYRRWNSLSGWSTDVLLPLAGKDLIPRWIQLSSDSSSNQLFLGVLGQSANAPTGTTCSIGGNEYHNYLWNGEGWITKEVLSAVPSGAFQFGSLSVYGESYMTAFNADAVPPAPVSDLTVTGVTGNSVTLQWTSTGDDGSLGKAAGYTIYYSTSSSFNVSFSINVQPVFVTGPSVTESYTFTVNGLSPSTTYYFAITATDKGGNISPLSTINPSATTFASGGGGPGVPAAIRDLMVVPGTLVNNSVQLTWTAPFISSAYSGTGAAYDLRWSSVPITNDASFNSANPVIALDGTGRNGLPSPHLAGAREFFNFTGLSAGITYFAVKTCGPGAMDPATSRCTGTPANLSPINTNGPVSVNNSGVANIAPPSAVTDLAITNISFNTMTLRWTAPGSSGQTGTAAQYDIRYSTVPIDPANPVSFTNARQILSAPRPLPAGTIQSFTVTNLISNTTSGNTYYFAIKAVNSSGNSSLISNVASGTTLPVFDSMPPAPITDLSVVLTGVNDNSVLLSWTATGDDGVIGTAIQYDIRYSEFPIVEDGTLANPNRQIEFKNALQVKNPPLPAPSGRHELFTVTGLDSNTVYYFAIKAIDKASNDSSNSTCVNCPGQTALHSGYNLVSVPYRLSGVSDPTSVFGNDVSKPVTIYRWNNGAYSVPSLVAEGAGYFLYATGNNSVLKASDAKGSLLGTAETSATVTTPLQSGWNMIGNPYLHPIFLKDTCVKRETEASVPFATAAAKGWIGNSIYSFNGAQYISEIFLDPLGINPPADLDPWNGYWMQLLVNDASYSLVFLDTPGVCP